jgi:hypothetical protein
MPKPWMIYGANGYTGELIAREAVSRGLKPVLAGRTPAKVSSWLRALACRRVSLISETRRRPRGASKGWGLSCIVQDRSLQQLRR